MMAVRMGVTEGRRECTQKLRQHLRKMGGWEDTEGEGMLQSLYKSTEGRKNHSDSGKFLLKKDGHVISTYYQNVEDYHFGYA